MKYPRRSGQIQRHHHGISLRVARFLRGKEWHCSPEMMKNPISWEEPRCTFEKEEYASSASEYQIFSDASTHFTGDKTVRKAHGVLEERISATLEAYTSKSRGRDSFKGGRSVTPHLSNACVAMFWRAKIRGNKFFCVCLCDMLLIELFCPL